MRIACLAWLLLWLPPVHAEDRVAKARAERTEELRALFARAHVSYPPAAVYVRAFKQEGTLELWAGARGAPLVRVAEWPVCARSGELGPKREQGDLQVPEGFYEIDRFNPASAFHLSLGVSYPNASDRRLGARGQLGGDIFIHGACVTIGCLPIEDGPIELLYLALLDARANGARALPVHLFPARLDDATLAALARERPAHAAFWRSLQPAYLAFERTHRVPPVRVDPRTGRYLLGGTRSK